MQHAADGRLLVVCDTCVLINFLVVGRIDLLTHNPDFQCLVTAHVVSEVTESSQAAALAEAISQGRITVIEITDPSELVTFAELRRFLGSGESAAVAAALHRDLAVATDDGRTRREIDRRFGPGRLVTTPGILVRAIRSGLLSVSDADAIKRQLEKRRFKMSFQSFADLT